METTAGVLYERILLKLSGESLTENGYRGLKRKAVDRVIAQVASIWPAHQVAITVGGGNIYRGSGVTTDLELDPEDAVDADWVGMHATHINGIMLKRLMRKAGINVHLLLAKPFPDIGEMFTMDKADARLNKGQVIILAGGTGKPRFTTDTGAVQSACELRADLVLKATKVDGIYDRDPVKHPDAVRIPYISYDEYLRRDLGIMDVESVAMARRNLKRIRVFNVLHPGSLALALADQGTYSDIGPAI